jgi:phosphatidate cytidylyltransferase
MWTRIITGLVLTPVVVAAVWFAPDTAGAGLVVLATGLAAREYLGMWSPKIPGPARWFMVLWTMAGPALMRLAPEFFAAYLFATPLLALGMFLLMPARIPEAFGQSAVMGMGVLYVGGLMSSAAALTVIPGRGTAALLTLFVVVWMGDTLAYFGGKALGRHKLYPAVSPKKTLEGSVAGLAGSVGGALLVDALVPTGLSPLSLVLLGLAGGAIEQAGDLSESVLKRCVGIKDSGNLLPGHGGMLDRIDGLLFAAPVVWAFFTF